MGLELGEFDRPYFRRHDLFLRLRVRLPPHIVAGHAEGQGLGWYLGGHPGWSIGASMMGEKSVPTMLYCAGIACIKIVEGLNQPRRHSGKSPR